MSLLEAWFSVSSWTCWAALSTLQRDGFELTYDFWRRSSVCFERQSCHLFTLRADEFGRTPVCLISCSPLPLPFSLPSLPPPSPETEPRLTAVVEVWRSAAPAHAPASAPKPPFLLDVMEGVRFCWPRSLSRRSEREAAVYLQSNSCCPRYIWVNVSGHRLQIFLVTQTTE